MTNQEVEARRLLDEWAMQWAEWLAEREANVLNAQQPVRYLGNTVTSTYQGPSAVIWSGSQPGGSVTPGAWIEDMIVDPAVGMHFYEGFESSSTPGLYPIAALTQATMGRMALLAPAGGGINDAGIVGGAIQMQAGSLAIASTNQITEVLYSAVGCFRISGASSTSGSLQNKLAFEARVALTSITNGARDVFVGLIDQAPKSTAALQALFPFTQAGSSSNNLTSTYNLIGFYFPSASTAANPTGDCQFVYQLASNAPVFASNLGGLISNVTGAAIAAGTYYKLGFIYDPQAQTIPIGTATNGQTVGNSARGMLRIYINGIQAAAFLTQANNILTASFPTGIMGPIAAISPCVSGTSNSGSASAGLLNVDFIRVAQTAQT